MLHNHRFFLFKMLFIS